MFLTSIGGTWTSRLSFRISSPLTAFNSLITALIEYFDGKL